MFNVVDENLSWYQKENIQSCLKPKLVDLNEAEFQESNLMHGKKKKKKMFSLKYFDLQIFFLAYQGAWYVCVCSFSGSY